MPPPPGGLQGGGCHKRQKGRTPTLTAEYGERDAGSQVPGQRTHIPSPASASPLWPQGGGWNLGSAGVPPGAGEGERCGSSWDLLTPQVSVAPAGTGLGPGAWEDTGLQEVESSPRAPLSSSTRLLALLLLTSPPEAPQPTGSLSAFWQGCERRRAHEHILCLQT